MNDFELDQLAKSYAEEIMLEIKEHGGDQFDLAHQYADGSEYVIYYSKAHELCQNCNIDNGEEWFEEVGPNKGLSYGEVATVIAYGELYTRILNQINEIEEQAA